MCAWIDGEDNGATFALTSHFDLSFLIRDFDLGAGLADLHNERTVTRHQRQKNAQGRCGGGRQYEKG